MLIAAAGGEIARTFVELGLVFVVLSLLARFGDRFGFTPIPLFLLTGLAVGGIHPPSFSEDFIELGAGIGVILLLFMLGLEYSGEELRTNLRIGLRSGGVDLALNMPPGVIAGLLLGWSPAAALLLGGVTYISSSGIISKTLSDLGRLGNRETPSVLTILVIEDLVMAAYLPLIAVLLLGVGLVTGITTLTIAITAAVAVLLLAVHYGEHVSAVVSSRSDEVLLLSVFGLILVVSGVAEMLQVSSAVGAFLVGIALSGHVADRTRVLLEPLRDLFAATFFLFFGLQIDVGGLLPMAGTAVALAVITASTKLYTGWWAARRVGVAVPGRVRAGTALIPRGEFSIVIAGLGVAARVEPQLGPLAAAYVLLLALAGPVLTRAAEPIAERFRIARSGTEPAT